MNPSSWVFSARTLDDTKLYPASLEVNARSRSWVSDSPKISGGGLRWDNKYGFVGITWAVDTPGVYDDGMNEHGLSVAQNQLDETIFPNITNHSCSIGMRSVVAWLLGNAANVSEAHAMLNSNVQIWGRPGGGPGGDAGAERQHLHILDAAGGELLVEWTGGQQHIYGAADGVWGTTTNSPDFPTMRAMRKYQATFPTAFSDPNTDNSLFRGGGRGGLSGVPAAYDSWSRQARAHLLNSVRPTCASQSQAVAWAFRVIEGSACIPIGFFSPSALRCLLHFLLALSVPGTPGGLPPTPPLTGEHVSTDPAGFPIPADSTGDFTQWQIVRDHVNRMIWSRTWDNVLPKSLNVASQNYSEGAPRLTFIMGDGAWEEEMAAKSTGSASAMH
jgi:penicillin V acylase-like amidase (Ntn superfamily)